MLCVCWETLLITSLWWMGNCWSCDRNKQFCFKGLWSLCCVWKEGWSVWYLNKLKSQLLYDVYLSIITVVIHYPWYRFSFVCRIQKSNGPDEQLLSEKFHIAKNTGLQLMLKHVTNCLFSCLVLFFVKKYYRHISE